MYIYICLILFDYVCIVTHHPCLSWWSPHIDVPLPSMSHLLAPGSKRSPSNAQQMWPHNHAAEPSPGDAGATDGESTDLFFHLWKKVMWGMVYCCFTHIILPRIFDRSFDRYPYWEDSLKPQLLRDMHHSLSPTSTFCIMCIKKMQL